MLYILFASIILLPALLGFGSIFIRIFDDFHSGIASKMIFGIFSISIIFTILAFFVPLGTYVEIPTLLVGLAAFFYFKEYENCYNFFARHQLIFPAIFLIIAFLGSYFPFILDHFGYYVPTVKWISEVGLVQGISNLDLLLGQMSVWHIFQAGLSNFSDPFLRLNTVILIIYLIYTLERNSWIQLVFLPVLFLFSQSPSPDLPVIVFSLVILNEILIHNKNSLLLFTFSVFVFAIKPTMIWVPILSFLYSIFILKSSFRFTIIGVCVLLLFFIKNIWTFGFPVFPVQVLDFGLSWKPNTEVLKNSSEMAIQKTYDMQYSFSEIEKFSTSDYVKNWLFLKGMKGKIHLLFVFTIITLFVFALIRRSRLIWFIFVSVLIKSLLILFFSAQYRFFLDVFFVVFFVVFYRAFSRKTSVAFFFIMSLFFAGFLSFPNMVKTQLPSFKLGSFMSGFKVNQLYLPSFYAWNHYKTYQVGNLRFNIVKDYIFSFDTPIPAISPSFIQEDLDAGIFPQLKGKTLKEGFIWKKISPQEKLQIQKILDEYNHGLETKK